MSAGVDGKSRSKLHHIVRMEDGFGLKVCHVGLLVVVQARFTRPVFVEQPARAVACNDIVTFAVAVPLR